MRLAKIKIRILWSDKQDGNGDNHRNICEMMSESGGNSVFFVLWKSLTEHFEDAMIKVWKTFKMFIEENGEKKKTQQLTNKTEKVSKKHWRINWSWKLFYICVNVHVYAIFLQHIQHFWHNHSKVKQLLDGCNERKTERTGNNWSICQSNLNKIAKKNEVKKGCRNWRRESKTEEFNGVKEHIPWEILRWQIRDVDTKFYELKWSLVVEPCQITRIPSVLLCDWVSWDLCITGHEVIHESRTGH